MTEKLRIPVFEKEIIEELKGDVLGAGSIQKKVGSGYEYPNVGHLVALTGETRGSRKAMLKMAGF